MLLCGPWPCWLLILGFFNGLWLRSVFNGEWPCYRIHRGDCNKTYHPPCIIDSFCAFRRARYWAMSNERSAAGHGQWTLGNPHWTQIMTSDQIGLLLAVFKFRPNAAKLASINTIGSSRTTIYPKLDQLRSTLLRGSLKLAASWPSVAPNWLR